MVFDFFTSDYSDQVGCIAVFFCLFVFGFSFSFSKLEGNMGDRRHEKTLSVPSKESTWDD